MSLTEGKLAMQGAENDLTIAHVKLNFKLCFRGQSTFRHNNTFLQSFI